MLLKGWCERGVEMHIVKIAQTLYSRIEGPLARLTRSLLPDRDHERYSVNVKRE